MEVELARSKDADCLIVHCDEPDLNQALVDLYFRREHDSFLKRFPVGSVTDEILARFRRHLIPLLRQAVRLDAAPWSQALHDAAERLDDANIDWWLAGSAALAVRGLQVEPRDLDLVVAESDAGRTAELFHDALIEPAVEVQNWISRWFGRAWLGARVEWIAGVSAEVDEPLPSDFGPAAAARLSEVRWEQRPIRVPPLELQQAVSARRGLAERVAMIEQLSRQSG
jgi:hypothetical protein